MKQRCAILTCDYFDGGECQNLCAIPKPQRIDTSALTEHCRQVGHEPIEPATEEQDGLTAEYLACALICALVLVVLHSMLY